MSLRENSQEIHALFPYGRLVGGVGGVNAGEKSLELVRFKSPSNGFEFRRRYRLSITVGELGKARENPVLEIVSHYLDFFSGPVSQELRVWRWSLRDLRRHCRRLWF